MLYSIAFKLAVLLGYNNLEIVCIANVNCKQFLKFTYKISCHAELQDQPTDKINLKLAFSQNNYARGIFW